MEKLEGDNLAELWMSFLLLESEGDLEGTASRDDGGGDDGADGVHGVAGAELVVAAAAGSAAAGVATPPGPPRPEGIDNPTLTPPG